MSPEHRIKLVMARGGGPEKRFWAKVNKSTVSGCWEWTGTFSSSGYGTFWLNGRMTGAHRYAYERIHGPLPKRHHALHRCDNRKCVREKHIFAGTNKDNQRDKIRKGRSGLPGKRWKIDQPMLKAIAKSCRSGMLQKSAAKEFGVCLRTVQRAVAAGVE